MDLAELSEAFDDYRQINNAHVSALRATVIALIDIHPDKAGLSAHMGNLAERLTSNWLGSELSDLFVSEFQKTMADLQSRAQSV